MERRYREMVENVNSVIILWNRDLTIEFINPFGAKFFGYEKGELEGMTLLGTIVADADSAGRSLGDMLSEIIEKPDSFVTNENENVTRDGRKTWISWTNRAILADDGTVERILSVGNDITELKKAQMELKRSLDANMELLKEMEELNSRLKVMASTDQLTGLMNRRKGMKELVEEIFRGRRHKYPVGVLMIDIDHFKNVNDTHGHAAGDDVLRATSSILTGIMRREDTISRIGGEEIMVILPYSSRDRCYATGERLRMAVDIESSALHAEGKLPCGVTISVGGASTENVEISGDALLKSADDMLYRSKESGRNRVTVSGMD